MAEIIIAGRPIPAMYIAIGLPVLAVLYLALNVTGEEGMMARIASIQAIEEGLEAKRAESEELRRRTREIDTMKQETEAIERSITLLKAKIPGDAQVPVLLYDVERMAKASHAGLQGFQPEALRAFSGTQANAAQPPDPNAPADPAFAGIHELPVKVQAKATYPELIRFLDQLGAYERKLNVSNMSLALANGERGGGVLDGKDPLVFKNKLSVEFTLSAYMLKRGGATP